MSNKQLLKRIEKLEQAIQDVWASCSCLTKDFEDNRDETIYCFEPPEIEEESEEEEIDHD